MNGGKPVIVQRKTTAVQNTPMRLFYVRLVWTWILYYILDFSGRLIHVFNLDIRERQKHEPDMPIKFNELFEGRISDWLRPRLHSDSMTENCVPGLFEVR